MASWNVAAWDSWLKVSLWAPLVRSHIQCDALYLVIFCSLSLSLYIYIRIYTTLRSELFLHQCPSTGVGGAWRTNEHVLYWRM